MPMIIRRATPDDAALMSRIATDTFVETFGHLYPPEDLAYFLANSYSPAAQREMLEKESVAMWLLEQDGIPLGHACAGNCGLPHPDAKPGHGELKRLYVLRQAHNSGWGSKLFETVLAWLEEDGPRTLWIGVWSENLGAQRFYGRYGFERVGEYKFPVGNTLDDEFILCRPATAA
ncbi:MAG: GNAT family N-acetyltransferase [Lysobacteraceae bacterium]|nr:MAG: GNAT family N-acetyltransferase [Xanthomonadaceae bacterium]